ncbi:MAG: hypothetical protein IJN48_04215 [Clostridia bacterium]|nr:hypothetical protein [Clostridia bacterium]
MKKLCIILLLTSVLFSCTNTDIQTTVTTTVPETTLPVTEETAAETTTEEIISVPEDTHMDFVFLSGAGGWWTDLTVKRDGSFFGEFHDSEMGSVGDDYPNGTVYVCNFEGLFKNFEKVNEYTYSMSIDHIDTEHEVGSEWIEDGTLYIASEPYGLNDGYEFLLYTPDTPVNELPDDFKMWIRPANETLDIYAIRNLTTDYGFSQCESSYDIKYECELIAEQYIHNVMTEEWLNEGYTFTYLDAFRFISSLAMYCDNAGHPFNSATTLNEEELAFCIDKAYALELISDVFGIAGFESSDYHTTMYHPESDTYRTPYGIGLYSSPFSYENMKSDFDGEHVYVSFTLVNSDRYEYEEKVYGDYTFVFDTAYKLIDIR